ncbi:BON domain-containing protein [Variovorax sp. DT-64]|uniref:BON domain-containing protein n=1 Tax=Variovorax sp. DT-64 TaxID=3396160 RepID=UPI003F1D80D9
MRDFLSFAAGVAAGTLAMYYLDKQSGRRRRALVRDKLVAAGHDAADLAESAGKRTVDRLKGIVATGRLDRVGGHEPESDSQLHERIRARLGRVVSHPKSIQVEVDRGEVCLRGHILTGELDELLYDVGQMRGVQTVRNELTCHDTAQGIPELQGSTEPAGQAQY